MKFYDQQLSDVFKALNSSENGLTSNEAQQVLEKNGPNKLAEAEKVTLVQRFVSQLKDPLLILLLAAAAVSAVTAAYSGESFTDVFIILAVVLLNAIMGVYQESKAEKAIEALSKMTAATSKVIRDGKQIVVESTQLVEGDVIVLEAGDAVPADARIIECASIKAEEAALTGESVPVTKTEEVLETEDGKDVPLGDRKNMVYMGSTIAYGRGKAVITGTGMNTEMGKIADALIKTENNETPLQKKL
ncbi:MAG: HAD-IC family P-type ATPase, partial [Oscillospiraceae bacterium]|nr:HAD-IC family P-type ATPase [Oscillospiraceae bacterium]